MLAAGSRTVEAGRLLGWTSVLLMYAAVVCESSGEKLRGLRSVAASCSLVCWLPVRLTAVMVGSDLKACITLVGGLDHRLRKNLSRPCSCVGRRVPSVSVMPAVSALCAEHTLPLSISDPSTRVLQMDAGATMSCLMYFHPHVRTCMALDL